MNRAQALTERDVWAFEDNGETPRHARCGNCTAFKVSAGQAVCNRKRWEAPASRAEDGASLLAPCPAWEPATGSVAHGKPILTPEAQARLQRVADLTDIPVDRLCAQRREGRPIKTDLATRRLVAARTIAAWALVDCPGLPRSAVLDTLHTTRSILARMREPDALREALRVFPDIRCRSDLGFAPPASAARAQGGKRPSISDLVRAEVERQLAARMGAPCQA